MAFAPWIRFDVPQTLRNSIQCFIPPHPFEAASPLGAYSPCRVAESLFAINMGAHTPDLGADGPPCERIASVPIYASYLSVEYGDAEGAGIGAVQRTGTFELHNFGYRLPIFRNQSRSGGNGTGSMFKANLWIPN